MSEATRTNSPGAIEVTGIDQLRCWRQGALPPVEQVRPGLWSIPVPLPNSALRYVLVYVLELDDGVALVDAGWNTEEAWAAVTAGLTAVGGSVSDVTGVLVTHIHPDHYGLAGRVREQSGAWVALHPADAAVLSGRYGDFTDLLAGMRALLHDCGVPGDDTRELSEASVPVRQFVSLVQPDLLLEDGDRAPLPGWNLRAVWTPGHSPGHLCFYDETRRLLFSGDHVLPRITPNISIHTQQPDDPLSDFLDALMAVGELDVDEVLPAHEYRFRRLRNRVDALLVHHDQRLAEIEGLLEDEPGLSCWQVSQRLRWSRLWSEIESYMQRAANGETLAHLVLLERRRRVVREGSGPWRWRVADR